jgi:hypothetical protein
VGSLAPQEHLLQLVGSLAPQEHLLLVAVCLALLQLVAPADLLVLQAQQRLLVL